MNIEELSAKFSDINYETMDFKDLVNTSKDICNNYAIESHCQSTFLIDKEQDFLAEIFSKNESYFVAINNRYSKNVIAIYAIAKSNF